MSGLHAYGKSKTDHVGYTVDELKLSSQQLKKIEDVFTSHHIQNNDFKMNAAASRWDVNRHQIYRYLAACGWADLYNGRSIENSVVETVNWRKNFGISSIDKDIIAPLIEKGIAYVNGADKHGRSILYFKFGRMVGKGNTDDLLKGLMYTVERADSLSVKTGSGEFIAIIDFEGGSLKQMPPFKVISTTINLLKLHYPYRLGGIYVINTGMAFNWIWRLTKPLLPKLALSKTHIVKKSEKHVLFSHIGEEFIEEAYGGKTVAVTDLAKYLREDEWVRRQFL
jgi:hypothetical protein